MWKQDVSLTSVNLLHHFDTTTTTGHLSHDQELFNLAHFDSTNQIKSTTTKFRKELTQIYLYLRVYVLMSRIIGLCAVLEHFLAKRDRIEQRDAFSREFYTSLK